MPNLAEKSSSRRRTRSDDPRTHFAWQGWSLRVPRDWNPVKLEGAWDEGTAVMADLQAVRVALRWKKVPSKPQQIPQLLLSTFNAQSTNAQTDPVDFDLSQLPFNVLQHGKDQTLFLAYSTRSSRLLQVTFPNSQRCASVEEILKSLTDFEPCEEIPWSIFDLRFLAPKGFGLLSHRLNAGDLTLHFAQGARRFSIRQLSVATLALQRLPLGEWLEEARRSLGKLYREQSAPGPLQGQWPGYLQQFVLARRYFWRHLPREQAIGVVHDRERDRLYLLHGSDRKLVEEITSSLEKNVQMP